jgi:hypothetical protein
MWRNDNNNGQIAAQLESQKREYESKLKEKEKVIQSMKAKQRYDNAMIHVNNSMLLHENHE